MGNILFVASLAILFFSLLAWGFRSLTREDWQIALATPTAKVTGSDWKGRNYTYYGVFQALAFVTSAALLCVLVSSLRCGLDSGLPLCLIAVLTVLCFSASKILARVVEKKKHTFTTAGAFFVGLLAAPWLIVGMNNVRGATAHQAMPIMPIMAAGTVAYAIGEGLGRLACISFGCCYGKPVSLLHPGLQRVFRRHTFTFEGKTRKIAYEAGLDGTEVVPIQAITAVFLVSMGLAGIYLFLEARYVPAFLLTTLASQAWRYLSETLRADHRGTGNTSAYQVMAVIVIVYALALSMTFPHEKAVTTDILTGVGRLWDPAAILILQVLGAGVFLYTGKSRVTESMLSFHVRRDRI
jgi:hypothetical protein